MKTTNKSNKIYWHRKVNKIRSTYYICLPKEYVSAMNVQKGQTLRMNVGSGSTLIVIPEGGKK